jgi:hypothetical protein
MRFLSITVLCIVCLGFGCQSNRIDPPAPPGVQPPAPVPPGQDVPPKPETPKNPESSVKPPRPPAVPDEEKAALLYYSRVDLLRIMICSEEKIVVDNETIGSDEYLQSVKEHFSNIGFRVVEGSPCLSYNSTAFDISKFADTQDVDMYVLLTAKVRQVDKFGNFYSYEADGRGKVSQINGNELLTTQSTTIRGKRALNADQAAKIALQQCGADLGPKLSDEILRKSGRGLLLRRVEVDGLGRAELVDYVRVGLSSKPGVQSVTLQKWDQKSGRAVFWVRINADAKENLGAYLEQLDHIRLKVKRLDQSGPDSRQKFIIEP